MQLSFSIVLSVLSFPFLAVAAYYPALNLPNLVQRSAPFPLYNHGSKLATRAYTPAQKREYIQAANGVNDRSSNPNSMSQAPRQRPYRYTEGPGTRSRNQPPSSYQRKRPTGSSKNPTTGVDSHDGYLVELSRMNPNTASNGQPQFQRPPTRRQHVNDKANEV
ncbi:hypothetical protein H0H92_012811 [Tricholoma furcatifolium]|nr:hypothetical protein H0H92_012811 [Tricholoma furcatifolium]